MKHKVLSLRGLTLAPCKLADCTLFQATFPAEVMPFAIMTSIPISLVLPNIHNGKPKNRRSHSLTHGSFVPTPNRVFSSRRRLSVELPLRLVYQILFSALSRGPRLAQPASWPPALGRCNSGCKLTDSPRHIARQLCQLFKQHKR
ncbi:hypothetical protein LIA77_11809 [Sarocladium implicatum]|nr:hypothetical protein LIA77_11809 [Sarocladium implicatum]